MKKTIFAVMLLMSVAFSISSCSKEKTAKEKAAELLVGKWYFQSINESGCFDGTNFLIFENGGGLTDNEKNLVGGTSQTYTLSEDGKTLTIMAEEGKVKAKTISFNVIIETLDANNLRLNLKGTDGADDIIYELSKTAGTCTPT